MNIEDDLKTVLRRREPPPGFADRVMERVEAGFSPPAIGGLKAAAPLLRALAAAALIAVILGGWAVHAAVRARNEVLIAMRIASHKVAQAQHEVNRR